MGIGKFKEKLKNCGKDKIIFLFGFGLAMEKFNNIMKSSQFVK